VPHAALPHLLQEFAQQRNAAGAQAWALSDGATLGDVTHLGCRAARYSPLAGTTCSPLQARAGDFPVGPGEAMPPVGNCAKQDYAVLFVVAVAD
jgi:hypothetical protein